MTPRAAVDFMRAAGTRGIHRWPTGDCGLCGYPMAYLISGSRVLYDAGCWCTPPVPAPEPRGWGDLAARYSMQTRPDVIAAMDRFWGFDPSGPPS